MTIFVVMGTTGEYSDRNEWPVVAYTDEQQAKIHIDAASEYARTLKIERDKSDDQWTFVLRPAPLDPTIEMNVYSDGTTYYYMTIELFDTVDAFAAVVARTKEGSEL